MSEVVPFNERIARLTAITPAASVLEDMGLVKILSIQEAQRARVRGALNYFLWSCLSHAFPEKAFPLTNDMLATYEADILKLPNITPNGLVLPKRENILAFNALQKEAAMAFAALGLGEHIARAQFPINIRLQNGAPDQAVDSRPRASVKPHSDIWAGDPASGILVFLSVLGDPSKSGIDFMQPKEFPLSYVRTLNDYNEGQPLLTDSTKIGSFSNAGWFLADPYLIHQTTKNAPGCRISLDFRFIPNKRVSSDIDEDETRKPFFIPFNRWSAIGSDKLIMTEEGMREFSPNKSKDPYTIGYPVKISIIDTDATYDLRPQKLAS